MDFSFRAMPKSLWRRNFLTIGYNLGGWMRLLRALVDFSFRESLERIVIKPITNIESKTSLSTATP